MGSINQSLFDGVFKEEEQEETFLNESLDKNSKKKKTPSEAHNYKPKFDVKYPTFETFSKETQEKIKQELNTDRYFKNSFFPIRNYIPIPFNKTNNYIQNGINENLVMEFCSLVSEGNIPETVSNYFKIPEEIYKKWLDDGQTDYENQNLTIYSYFFGELLRAMAIFEFNITGLIKRGDKEWRGLAWYIQRWNIKYRDNFIPKEDASKNPIEQLKLFFEENLESYKEEISVNENSLSDL